MYKTEFGGKKVYLDGKDISDLGPEEISVEGGWVRVRKLKPGDRIMTFGNRVQLYKLRGKVELKAPPRPRKKKKVSNASRASKSSSTGG